MQALQKKPKDEAEKNFLPQDSTHEHGSWFVSIARFISTEWKAEEKAKQQVFTLALRVKQRGNCFYIAMFLSPPFNVKPFYLL